MLGETSETHWLKSFCTASNAQHEPKEVRWNIAAGKKCYPWSTSTCVSCSRHDRKCVIDFTIKDCTLLGWDNTQHPSTLHLARMNRISATGVSSNKVETIIDSWAKKRVYTHLGNLIDPDFPDIYYKNAWRCIPKILLIFKYSPNILTVCCFPTCLVFKWNTIVNKKI